MSRRPASASPAVGELARRIAGLPAAQSVAAPLRLNATTWRIDATASGTPIGPQAQQLLTELRGLTTPFAVSVGGIAADYHDDQHAILERVPLALSALCLITLVLLWLLTDSVVLPVKALVMTGVTTAAALGLLVLIFQDGRLTGPLDYVSQGALEQTNFVVFAALVFALSTDYGVMLIARIQEEHAAGLDNREAVAVGIQRTGSLLSGAAVLLATALGVLATSSIVFVKELGVGTAVAVLIDAFVIRCLLLPSLMALLGDRNWWSPEWLHRVHRRMAHSISTVRLSPDTPEGPALTTLPKGPDRTPSV
ncbi:MMPL family transporter [Svornostia abyssi]|uniref:MMPL family transporter n=1 Tax=Svornostia abyssi TaxID=2898438 RepID=A0ABY5PH53_9ACTN|nr:MMPL family transporter [Parviterribacteraceae bacterium J379]